MGKRVLSLILENARDVGFITDHRGRSYVSLDSPPPVAEEELDESEDEDDLEGPREGTSDPSRRAADGRKEQPRRAPEAPPQDLSQVKRVFITHGSNKEIVGQRQPG